VSISFFTHDHSTYEDFLKFLNLYTLHNRRLYLEVLFLISVHSGLKCCLSLLNTTGIRVLPFNFRNSCLFSATCHNYLSAEWISAASHVCKAINIFIKPFTSLKQIMCLSVSVLYQIIYVFSGFRAFALVHYIDLPTILFLFCRFSVMFLCICCLVSFECVCCAVSVTGHFTANSAH
jgi:hypothetical protein